MGGVRARRKRRHGRLSLVDSQNAKIRKLYPPMRGIIALFQSLFSGRNLLKADAQCGVGFFHIITKFSPLVMARRGSATRSRAIASTLVNLDPECQPRR